MRLKGKVAFITGSTKGIGAEIARRFAAEGASVAVCGRSKDAGEKVVARIREAGGKAIFVSADVGIEAEVTAAVRKTVEHFGALHILINNAAPVDVLLVGGDKPLLDMSIDEFDRILRITLHGAIFACRAAIPEMIKAGGGSIVNTSSMASIVGIPNIPAYTCGKGALNALTRQIAVDYAEAGIRSNALIVGFVASESVQEIIDKNPEVESRLRTGQLTRVGRSEDIAEAALYFASDASAYATGVLFTIDGGISCEAHMAPTRVAA